jgi:hypothetical protein
MADVALNVNVKHKKIPRATDPNQSIVSEHHQLNQSVQSVATVVGGGNNQENSDNESYLGAAKNRAHESQCSLHSGGSSQPETHPFFKDPSGRFIVLYTFIARDENDVSVERGEFVTVLNREDPDWYWIVRSDGQEGFIPSAFVYPAELMSANTNNNNSNQLQQQQLQQQQQQHHQPKHSVVGAGYGNQSTIAAASNHNNLLNQSHDTMNQPFPSPGMQSPGAASLHHQPSGSDAEMVRCQGTELVMLYDYKVS